MKKYLLLSVLPLALAAACSNQDSSQEVASSTAETEEMSQQAGDTDIEQTAEETMAASAINDSQPFIEQRADPWITQGEDGRYYFIATVPDYDQLEIRASDTLAGLKDAEPKVIWEKKETGPMGHHIWAPELHWVDGAWRIYFAAGEAENIWNIRMYALSNPSANPLEGEWTENGRVLSDMDDFSLDATTFEHRGKRYYIWAQRLPREHHNTGLVMSEMASATELTGPEIILTEPTLDWEIQGHYVNEGAAVIKHGGRIFITYSASATDHNYAVGLLWADEDADLMDPASWNKSQEPVFASNPDVSRFGPGHNSFTKTADGQDVLVYHARTYKEIEGNPLDNPDRHTFLHPFTWTEDGFPDFGKPGE
uniref:Alpha-N-arabinofuranosidase n=2 Tax=Aquisalinus luteolus TaxID=1566827 RepID=A0A8J3A396_9PROT|nr:alpha-N-arabinofuranosidase [Aquisalinus luteolus]